MDATYLISGAADLCRDLSVRNLVDITRLLTVELRHCRPIQDIIEDHIASHKPEGGPNTICSPVCLLEFMLSDACMYTKQTPDLTSALARYTKRPTIDVNEHLAAHLAKEEDLIRRTMYGNEDITGSTYPALLNIPS